MRIIPRAFASVQIIIGELSHPLVIQLNGIVLSAGINLVSVPLLRNQGRPADINLVTIPRADGDVVNRSGAVLVKPVGDSLLRIAAGKLVNLYFEARVNAHECLVVVEI